MRAGVGCPAYRFAFRDGGNPAGDRPQGRPPGWAHKAPFGPMGDPGEDVGLPRLRRGTRQRRPQRVVPPRGPLPASICPPI